MKEQDTREIEFSLAPETARELAQTAREMGITEDELMARALWEYFNEPAR